MSELERRLRTIEATLDWMNNSNNILAEELDKLMDKVDALDSEVNHLMAKDQSPMQVQPDSDGWIPNYGGECPVENDELVDIQLRNGSIYRVPGGAQSWSHHSNAPHRHDITHYRPAEQEAEPGWPRFGDEYWYINEYGMADVNIMTDAPELPVQAHFLGIYPTEEKAEEISTKVKRIMDHLRKGNAVNLVTEERHDGLPTIQTFERIEL